MSRKSKKKSSTNTGRNAKAKASASQPSGGLVPQSPGARAHMDYLAAAPALFMCAMTLLVLFLDLAIPGMLKDQYTAYPSLFRLVHVLTICCGLAFLVLSVRSGTLRAHSKDRLSPGTSLAGRFLSGLSLAERFCIICFVLLMLWMLLSTAVNGLNDPAIHGIPYRNLGVFHILALFLFYFGLSTQVHRRSLRVGLLAGFLAVSDLIGLATLMDLYVHAVPAFAQKKEISAIFFNGNHYGYFLTMAVLVAAGLFLAHPARQLRVFSLLSLLLNLFVLLLNHSLGCLLAVGLALLALLVVSLVTDRAVAQRLFILFAALAAAGILAGLCLPDIREEFLTLSGDLGAIAGGENSGGGVPGTAGHNRWLLWSVTTDLILQRPLIGFGCEGISDLLMSELGRGNPHNELLNYAVSYGIPSALLYLAGLLTVAVIWIRRRVWNEPAALAAALGALGYFLSSLVGVPMFYTAPFFFILLGLSLCQDARR